MYVHVNDDSAREAAKNIIRERKSVRASERAVHKKKINRRVSIFFCAIQADGGDSKAKNMRRKKRQ
jgi:hypothetical protein